MSWVFKLTPTAEKDLKALPKAIQKRVARTAAQMAADPFAGNVKALQGAEWKGGWATIASSFPPTTPLKRLPSTRYHYAQARRTGESWQAPSFQPIPKWFTWPFNKSYSASTAPDSLLENSTKTRDATV